MSNAMLNIINQETTKEDHLKNYSDYPDTQPEGFTPFNASTVEPMFCEIPVGSKVLDVGCNSGEFMKMLQDAKGCQTVGVDVSKTALRLARKKGLKVKNASAESLPFKDGTFDVAILREVLVHIHEPVKALKEIRRVLKKDGFLLGSAPHANLERKLWDDKHLHHRYYDENTLQADLDQAFDVTHMKVLNGAQFSVSFAMSHLAEKPCELLFKCGGEGLPVWEAALMADKDTLRIWMGPTQQPGDVYYRMIGYAAKMRQMPGVEVGFEQFNWTSNDSCSEWQRKILANAEAEPISALALHHLEKCLKVANPWVFQITYYEDVIALFECAKQVYKDKKLVTEVDDWIFDVPSYNVASHPYKPNSDKEKIAFEQLQLSDAVIVSTSYIKENLQQMFPEKPIHVIPNSIDFNIWDNVQSDGKMEPKGEGVVRVGFTGCANHSGFFDKDGKWVPGDMEILKPVLLALLDEFPNLEVLIAQDQGCFKDINQPRLKILNRWTSIIDYPAMVKGWDLDIGIAPLKDNRFNRAKSNLRWLEYSALKLPTVASDVRPFTESIRDKWDGRLCKDKNEWYATLKLLIEQPAARKGFGDRAYETVKYQYNMDTIAIKYAEILKGLR